MVQINVHDVLEDLAKLRSLIVRITRKVKCIFDHNYLHIKPKNSFLKLNFECVTHNGTDTQRFGTVPPLAYCTMYLNISHYTKPVKLHLFSSVTINFV